MAPEHFWHTRGSLSQVFLIKAAHLFLYAFEDNTGSVMWRGGSSLLSCKAVSFIQILLDLFDQNS